MTALITRTIRQAAFVVAFAAYISALSSTSSFAYTAEAQQMCTGDAFRLCSSEIPNIAAHRLHAEEQGQCERRMPGRDGQGSGSAGWQGRRQVIRLSNSGKPSRPDSAFGFAATWFKSRCGAGLSALATKRSAHDRAPPHGQISFHCSVYPDGFSRVGAAGTRRLRAGRLALLPRPDQ